jgi:hypothetical protein
MTASSPKLRRHDGLNGLLSEASMPNNRMSVDPASAASPRVEERMATKTVWGAALLFCAAGLAANADAAWAARQPPSCAAIAFRPILSRSGDGQQDAGLYKSRFGRIEVKAMVKNGVTQRYFVEINGKPLAPVGGALPPSLAVCAKAKRLSPPTPSRTECVGDQLTVLIDHSGDTRYVLLYVHHAGSWHFCSIGTS